MREEEVCIDCDNKEICIGDFVRDRTGFGAIVEVTGEGEFSNEKRFSGVVIHSESSLYYRGETKSTWLGKSFEGLGLYEETKEVLKKFPLGSRVKNLEDDWEGVVVAIDDDVNLNILVEYDGIIEGDTEAEDLVIGSVENTENCEWESPETIELLDSDNFVILDSLDSVGLSKCFLCKSTEVNGEWLPVCRGCAQLLKDSFSPNFAQE